MYDDGTSSFGIGHLSAYPITVSVGVVLLGILILLVVLRLAFGSVRLEGGVR
jgi:hypothetical protein